VGAVLIWPSVLNEVMMEPFRESRTQRLDPRLTDDLIDVLGGERERPERRPGVRPEREHLVVRRGGVARRREDHVVGAV
jgi:hypothetical protein